MDTPLPPALPLQPATAAAVTPVVPPASYADLAKSHREEKKFKMPEGDYLTLFKGHKYEISKKGKGSPMISLEFKPLEAPTAEDLAKLQKKNRMIITRFIFSPNTPWGIGDLVVFLEDIGADLSKCRPLDKDPEMLDLRAWLDAAELQPPKVKLNVTHQAGPGSYYNVTILECAKVWGPPAAATTVDTTAFTVAATEAAKLAETADPVVETATETVKQQAAAGPTYEAMIAAGWTDETLAANPQYAHLVPVAEAAPPSPPTAETAPAPPGATQTDTQPGD